MREVEIQIYNIAQTKSNFDEIRKWIDDLGAPEYEVPNTFDEWINNAAKLYPDKELDKVPENRLITDSARLIGMAGKRCYMSFGTELNPNITRVRNDWAEYLENVLKSGHGSVTEHAYYTFAIEGVSRVFTAEMNRHRAGVGISEGSMRYIRLEDIPFCMPFSIRTTEEENKIFEELDWRSNDELSESELADYEFIGKKLETQRIFRKAFKYAEDCYKEMTELWAKELSDTAKFKIKKEITSMMRRIIPIGVATGGVWTGNIRALRHMITMRAEPAAEEEIAYVFCNIAKYMVENEPMLFCDFTQDENGFWYPKYRKV